MTLLRKYGVATSIRFPLIDAGAIDFEATPVSFAAGDAKISKDGAAFGNTTNTPTHVGGGVYELDLTATEMQAANIIVAIIDQTATKEWEDQAREIDTYGNASAQHEADIDRVIPSAAEIDDELTTNHGGGVWGGVTAGAALNTSAYTYSLLTGTSTSGGYGVTATTDGIEHVHTDTGGALDLYYRFAIGGDGAPTSVIINGRVTGVGDDLDVQAYNWALSTWQKIGVLEGQATSVNPDRTYALLTAHVGTGASAGKVDVRLVKSSGLTSATLYIDRINVSYAVVSRTVGYQDGAVWVDTTGSNTNTEAYIDGTADNPVSTLAAARTIADNIGLRVFELAPGSSIVLDQSYAGYDFIGLNYTVDLNGQSVSGSLFDGATITGNDSGTNTVATRFAGCRMGSSTLAAFNAERCELDGTITLAAAGEYALDACYSGVAGLSTPGLDFGAAVGASEVSLRHYSGGIDVANMKDAGDRISIEGMGQVIVDATCTAGVMAIRGNFDLTDNSAGVTIVDTARMTQLEATPDRARIAPSYVGDTQTIDAAVWGERGGTRIASPTLCTVTWLGPDGSTLFSKSSADAEITGPTAGVYRLQIVQALAAGQPYQAIVSITDAVGTITTHHGIPTTG